MEIVRYAIESHGNKRDVEHRLNFEQHAFASKSFDYLSKSRLLLVSLVKKSSHKVNFTSMKMVKEVYEDVEVCSFHMKMVKEVHEDVEVCSFHSDDLL
ncbi:hypothetical protein QVD17_02053 [Tagetes erecta]|uniref:Uncharacterized protein n=1 Tax=Tagetes erecta TaxID=13708 RepID=A0AAD8L5W5_TARER|nr:hypothetical protein QVD17_02053 [Tagetes erecta]